MTPPKARPPLLDWRIEGRAAVVGMRANTIFVRIVREIEPTRTTYVINLTFPLPRGTARRDLRTPNIEHAKAVAEQVFDRWLRAVNLTPPEGMPLPRQRIG